MDPKRVSPMEGALNFLSVFPDMLLNPKFRSDALQDELPENICVDTVCPPDTGIWETGLKRESIEGKWVIVEQYPDKASATIGHSKWIKMMTDDPDLPIKDINQWNLESLKEG